jgi:ABC-type cobalamin/Fe3+-siderophores transport system ATPase subunit
VLVGPSAAGKSTLLHCLAGTTEVTQGDALICGQSVRYSYEFGNGGKVGFCPQGDVRARGSGFLVQPFPFFGSFPLSSSPQNDLLV